MQADVLIEIIVGGGAVLAGVFGLIKYLIGQNTKRESAILEHHREQQTEMMEFYEKKNNHLERIANKFTESNNLMTTAVGKLTTQIEILSSKQN